MTAKAQVLIMAALVLIAMGHMLKDVDKLRRRLDGRGR